MSWIGNYLLQILLGALGVLAFVTTLLTSRLRHEKAEKEIFRKQRDRATEVAKAETELADQAISDLRRLRDLEEAKGDLANPNAGWLRDRSD